MSVGVSAVRRRIAAGVDGPPFHFSFLWELMTATGVRACFLIYVVFCLLQFAPSQNYIRDTKAQRGLGFVCTQFHTRHSPGLLSSTFSSEITTEATFTRGQWWFFVFFEANHFLSRFPKKIKIRIVSQKMPAFRQNHPKQRSTHARSWVALCLYSLMANKC